MPKATPTIIRLTVSVVVDRDEYMREYGDTEIPKKSTLTQSIVDTVEAALEDSEIGQKRSIYTVDVL